MAEEGKQASSSIMLRPLWPGGIRIAKPGWSQSLCFGSLERWRWAGLAMPLGAAQAGSNWIRRAPAYRV